MTNKQTATRTFETSDTPLAAWLYSQGGKLIGLRRTDPNGLRTAFVFEDSDKVQELVLAYQTGNAVGNVSTYMTANKTLVSIVKTAENYNTDSQGLVIKP